MGWEHVSWDLLTVDGMPLAAHQSLGDATMLDGHDLAGRSMTRNQLGGLDRNGNLYYLAHEDGTFHVSNFGTSESNKVPRI